MSKHKILFVNQEITPYLEETYMSKIGRYLPQTIQESGIDIRIFMPRYGLVSERKNQLHEVIRLSGQNIIIKDVDHPLIIKVASIQSVRMQTYFIDNELYFDRKFILHDKNGKFFSDNDERAIFYAKGVIETVKNLGWAPDIIHCNGWISCLVPLYIKTAYKDNPLFTNSKVIYSVYNDKFDKKLNRSFTSKLKSTMIPNKEAAKYKDATYLSTTKLAIEHSDAVVIGEEDIDASIKAFIAKSGKINFVHPQDNFGSDYIALYERVLE
ncbi:MAG TPA: glycogen/starch synthase [Bacteroidales bacterium]|nr:glycogen/starch synthase [Bacteroidales bacterium]